MVESLARAKINLALHVTGQRGDGYHLLDSIVTFAEIGDVIRVSPAKQARELATLSISGSFGHYLSASADNLVLRAAKRLAEQSFSLQPVHIELEKNLPVASGIGGGSADAAATLLALEALWKTGADLYSIATELGADVAMCLVSKPLRALGTGDEITLLEGATKIPMVLVNPGVEVSTPSVFSALEKKDNEPVSTSHMNVMPDLALLKTLRNDLQLPARQLEQSIGMVGAAIAQTEPQLFRMSGSGATFFALYSSIEEAAAACARLQAAKPDWWCVATSTVTS